MMDASRRNSLLGLALSKKDINAGTNCKLAILSKMEYYE